MPGIGGRIRLSAGMMLSLAPGLIAAVLLAWLSLWLSDVIGVSMLGFEKSPVSPVMLAILVGLVLRATLPLPRMLRPGLGFAVKRVLRVGIVLLGIRLSIFDVLELGIYGVPIVLSCIVVGLFLTTRINRWLKLPERLGTLIAVGTSICGVSAIAATAPSIEANDDEVAYAVGVITVFGLLATLVYPYLADVMFAGRATQVGLFLGTSIHDTSQVVGSAKVYSDLFGAPRVLDIATVTKLVRNVFMAAVVPFMALRYSRKTQGRVPEKRTSLARLLPLFVLGFVVMAVVRSIGDAGVNAGGDAFGLWTSATWAGINSTLKTWAEDLLVVALAGVGLSTDLRSFKTLGLKPFLVGMAAALAVGVVSFAAISILGRFVQL